MPDHVNLVNSLLFGEINQMIAHQLGRTFAIGRGGECVFLHLVPEVFSSEISRDDLKGIVEAVQHEILRIIQEGHVAPASDGIPQNVFDRVPRIRNARWRK